MNNTMTYSFEQAQDEWKRLPFDNVAYINSSDILKKSKDEIKEMISQFEATRYGLSGWRNYENKWRAIRVRHNYWFYYC